MTFSVRCDSASQWQICFIAGDSLTVAAKEVAEVLGGDVKQTESELLNKLLSPSQAVNESESETQAPPMNLR